MSRKYEMRLVVREEMSKDDELLIREVFDDLWGEDSWARNPQTRDGSKNGFVVWGESYLSGGRSEDDFVRDLSQAIWGKLKRYVSLEVLAIYLEDPPTTEHIPSKESYLEFEATATCDECNGKLFPKDDEQGYICDEE